jgi:hypothetical protein
MSAIRYPIAANAAAALSAPLGRAARASEALVLAGGHVVFATEPTGPAFPSREAALDAFAGRVDDERPGRTASIQSEDRFCDIRELAEKAPPRPGKSLPPAPIYRDGRRWGPALPPPATVWRLSVSYWKLAEAAAPILQSREEDARNHRAGAAHDPKALRERIGQPLRPVKPQQPLDVGLFEFRPPDAPHILMPDE